MRSIYERSCVMVSLQRNIIAFERMYMLGSDLKICSFYEKFLKKNLLAVAIQVFLVSENNKRTTQFKSSFYKNDNFKIRTTQ